MATKLMMMVEYPPSEASAGGGSMRGAVAVAVGAWADTWTDPDTGYTWTYRINGDTAEIMV